MMVIRIGMRLFMFRKSMNSSRARREQRQWAKFAQKVHAAQ